MQPRTALPYQAHPYSISFHKGIEDRFQYLVRRIGMRCLTPAELEEDEDVEEYDEIVDIKVVKEDDVLGDGDVMEGEEAQEDGLEGEVELKTHNPNDGASTQLDSWIFLNHVE
ncbi:hypothetical protein Tco_1326314 [Tanacetum coccineum]